MASLRRLAVLHNHIHTSSCASSSPTLTVTPSSALFDEKVDIILNGLKPNQTVTIVNSVQDSKFEFESCGVFKASRHGTVHNRYTPSIAGTFTGIAPMGLFWSLIPKVGQRMFKKDVETPLKYELSVYDGQISDKLDTSVPMVTTVVERWFKKKSVRRIPLKNGQFKGTVFLPEGPGPFPALVDMYGGLVTLVENRAALLASHGYATFALCYLYEDGLPQKYSESPLMHIKEATEWFSQQEYVDKERFGMLGLCYGGYLSLVTTSALPQVKVLVNISGVPIYAGDSPHDYTATWPNGRNVKITEAGVVIKDIWECPEPKPIPAWQHGAKILQICAMEDQQVNPKWFRFASERVPDKFRPNVKHLFYPGAGHIIDPPYTPHCSYIVAKMEKMNSLDFLPEQVRDKVLLVGGNPVDHAAAQEDAWRNILDFLEKNLKHPDLKCDTTAV